MQLAAPQYGQVSAAPAPVSAAQQSVPYSLSLPDPPHVSTRRLEDARVDLSSNLAPSQSVMFTPMSGLPDVPRVSPRRLEDARAEINQLAHPSQSVSYNPLTGFPEIPSASPRALYDTALFPKNPIYKEHMNSLCQNL